MATLKKQQTRLQMNIQMLIGDQGNKDPTKDHDDHTEKRENIKRTKSYIGGGRLASMA